MIIKRIEDVPAVAVEMDDAENVKVKVLFGPKDGAPTFAMRLFELGIDGHTPFHHHPFEHQVIVMEGRLAIVTEEGEFPLAAGDTVMVTPGRKHQFRNLSDTDAAKMICMVPVEYQK